MQALMALLLPQPPRSIRTRRSRETSQHRRLFRIDESGGAKRGATPDATAGTPPLPPQLQELISQLPQAKPESRPDWRLTRVKIYMPLRRRSARLNTARSPKT